MQFDLRGHLTPYTIHEVNLEDFAILFVHSFQSDAKRNTLFQEFNRYINSLRNVLEKPFYCWVDGSFISNKVSPNDIDFVSFINHELYTQKQKQIDTRFAKWAVVDNFIGLDAYTVWEYPENHEYFDTFKADKAYWYNWFSQTRYNRRKERFKKGFVQININ